MHVVAIHNLRGNEDLLAHGLAATLGKTHYETRSRVRAPGGGPSVVATFAEPEPAMRCAAELEARSFDTLVLDENAFESDARRFIVRSFELTDAALVAVDRFGGTLEVPYAAIDLLLRGTRSLIETETRTRKGRKFSVARLVLSGGLLMTAPTRTRQKITTEQRELFLHVYARDRPPLALRENGLLYQSLGAHLRPTRMANFAFLVDELRRRSTAALWDDRLTARSGQAQLLGTALSPDEYLDIAISLLARSLRSSSHL